MIEDDKIDAALKRALKEWLDDKLSEFGWFSIKLLAGAALAALVYFILQMNGWKH